MCWRHSLHQGGCGGGSGAEGAGGAHAGPQVYGAVTMNNTMCLGLFLLLVHIRGLFWDFTSEVIVTIGAPPRCSRAGTLPAVRCRPRSAGCSSSGVRRVPKYHRHDCEIRSRIRLPPEDGRRPLSLTAMRPGQNPLAATLSVRHGAGC